MTSLAQYADEVDAILRDIWRVSPRVARRLEDLAQRMRRDATIKPNPKPSTMFGSPPISGGREVHVVRERRRG